MTIKAVINQRRNYYINKFSIKYSGEPVTSWDNILNNLIKEFENYAEDEASEGIYGDFYGTISEVIHNGYPEKYIDDLFDTFMEQLNIENYDF